MESTIVADNIQTSCILGCLKLTTPIEDLYNKLCNRIDNLRTKYLLYVSRNKWHNKGSFYVYDQLDMTSVNKINWIYNSFGKTIDEDTHKYIPIDILRHYYGDIIITICAVGFTPERLNTQITVNLSNNKYIIDNEEYDITWNLVNICYIPKTKTNYVLEIETTDSE